MKCLIKNADVFDGHSESLYPHAKIVILEDGRVHAVGTHEQLLAGDPIYQEIYHSQMRGGDQDGQSL